MNYLKSKQAAKFKLPKSRNYLLQLMQEGLIVLDPAGYVTYVYDAAEDFFGVRNHKSLIGKHFSELC